jgi:pimeloyl-ACP methyl ester carboxylesterase
MTLPLVLLPGMMCDERLFTPQITAFAGERHVQILALTAHDTVEELAAVILEQAPPIFALAGLSMGGIVAMEVVRQMPHRVAKLALLDTNPLAEKPEVSANREPQIAKVREGRLAQVMREEMIPNYLSDGADTGEIADLCLAMAEALGAQVFERQSRALQSRPDQQVTLRRLTVPTLILCGEDDRLCPLERHELMHQLIPQSTLTTIPAAGHLPTLEQAELTTRALQQWLNT